MNTDGPNSHAYLGTPLAAGLPSSARYTATVSVRGLLVAEIQVLVSYRIHPSIICSRGSDGVSGVTGVIGRRRGNLITSCITLH